MKPAAVLLGNKDDALIEFAANKTTAAWTGWGGLRLCDTGSVGAARVCGSWLNLAGRVKSATRVGEARRGRSDGCTRLVGCEGSD